MTRIHFFFKYPILRQLDDRIRITGNFYKTTLTHSSMRCKRCISRDLSRTTWLLSTILWKNKILLPFTRPGSEQSRRLQHSDASPLILDMLYLTLCSPHFPHRDPLCIFTRSNFIVCLNFKTTHIFFVIKSIKITSSWSLHHYSRQCLNEVGIQESRDALLLRLGP